MSGEVQDSYKLKPLFVEVGKESSVFMSLQNIASM